jgi:hypothetical protein
MAVAFTFWIFNLVDITDVKQDEIGLRLQQILNRCVSTKGGIASASVRWAGQDDSISPAKFDVVVYLCELYNSMIRRAGGDNGEARRDLSANGLTTIGLAGGPVPEVYWDRGTLNETVIALFHEAAHAKSGQGHDTMNSDAGLNVLDARCNPNAVPNTADIKFFQKAILRPIGLRATTP